MSTKLLLIVSCTFVIIISPTLCQDHEINDKMEKIVKVKPNTAHLVRPTLQKGKMVFMQLKLPEEIKDLKAFTWDPIHHIPLFSGGVPNTIFAYTGHDDNFDTIVDDVSSVTSMDVDLDNELLMWTGSGHNVVEIMSLRTLERSAKSKFQENENFKVMNDTIIYNFEGCTKHCDQPFWGKVFKGNIQFRGKLEQSYKLMRHPGTGRIITAVWDGTNVMFSSEDADIDDFAIKEMADHTYMNTIYCGNFNGVAVLAM